jgi:hypothetical protein
LRGQIDLRNAQSVLPYYKFLLVIFSAVLYRDGAGLGNRVYCLGEQPITRRKALPKALSES